MRTLRLGSTGSDVAAWQKFLAAKKFKPGAADGVFGSGTEQATRLFQQSQHLDVDGVVGPGTFQAATAMGFQPPAAGTNASGDLAFDTIGGALIYQTPDGSAIYFTGKMDVDADGSPHAYNPSNTGLDNNKNGKDQNGNWVGVLTSLSGAPLKQGPDDPSPGYYISTTSLQDTTRPKSDPHRYVDSEKIPYIVLPGGHLGGATLGDYAVVINLANGKRISAIAADSGPKHKVGEVSIAVARALLGKAGSSPRTGGTDSGIRYVVFPNSGNGFFPASNDDPTLAATLAAIDAVTAPLIANSGAQRAFAA
jgi:peptidoglycan hydrolase-like protein with peptidoglycan-binding domain